MTSLRCGILENKFNLKNKLLDTENTLIVARGGVWEVGEMGKLLIFFCFLV